MKGIKVMFGIRSWRQKVKSLKSETYALYLAYKDPRTPWYARLMLLIVVGYALSPIDLIPDFIPIIGSLDDLIIVSLGFFLALKMIPKEVLKECREKAKERFGKPGKKSWPAAIIIVAIWLLAIYLVYRIFKVLFNSLL